MKKLSDTQLGLLLMCLIGTVLKGQVGEKKDSIDTKVKTFEYASISGVIRDDIDTSETLYYATVQLKNWFGDTIAATRTDSAGRFRIGGIVPGRYYIDCMHYYYYPVKMKRQQFKAGQELELNVKMRNRKADTPKPPKWKTILSWVPAAVLAVVALSSL